MIQHNDGDHLNGLSRTHEPRTVLAAALALALATVGGGAQASTQLVTNCQDSGSGSLRAAITAAMSGDVVDATGLACSTISLGTGALVVTANSLTVKGPGPNQLAVQGYTKYSQVLRHVGNGTLTLQGLTITNGVASPQGATPATKGGCIYSKGTVHLGDIFDGTDANHGVVVSDCRAISTQAGISAEGGGIFAQKGLTLSHSIVTHSQAIAQGQATNSSGGGIEVATGFFVMGYSEVSDCSATGLYGFGGGIGAPYIDTITVKHSTIAGNSASHKAGGALLGSQSGGLVQIDNSTISGNTAPFDGGLSINVVSGPIPGAIKMYSSTITGNTANSRTGGAFLFGPAEIESTIAAGNFIAGTQNNFSLAGETTGSNNLVGSVDDTPFQSNWIVAADPKLGPLANHGGFTRTHLPLPNSPAVNAGNNILAADNDQRGPGFARVIGSAPDIGAVEFDPDRIFINGFD